MLKKLKHSKILKCNSLTPINEKYLVLSTKFTTLGVGNAFLASSLARHSSSTEKGIKKCAPLSRATHIST